MLNIKLYNLFIVKLYKNIFSIDTDKSMCNNINRQMSVNGGVIWKNILKVFQILN